MKKFARSVAAMVTAVACVSAMSLSATAVAAYTREAPNVSGSYHAPSIAKAVEKVKPTAFLAPTVYVDPVTRAISNVYDADGNLIPATLSSDGHFYIVPTNEGYLYISTGY